jgi:hypothetical protein
MSIDDRIREALRDVFPESPVDADRLVAELTERFSGLPEVDGSSHIGETEENLTRVFDAAEAGGADMVFDEADALFGGRSEVRDSHDRYAEVNNPLPAEGGEAPEALSAVRENAPTSVRALDRIDGQEEGEAGSGPGPGATGAGGGLGFPLLGLIGAVVAGGLAGILIALSIGSPSPVSSATLGLDGVPVFACPGEGRTGTLHRGDRIFIVGQADGWLAVRNVRGGGETVFVEAQYVTPDDDVSDLPRRDCEPEGILTIGDLDTTTTTEPTGETTTTTAPEATTTTQPGATTTTQPGATTTTSATTTTTQPGATTTTQPGATTTTSATTTTTTAPAPSIGQRSVTPNTISEQYPPQPGSCGVLIPEEATLSVAITGPTQSASFTLSHSLGGGVLIHQGGGTWTAQIGPFENGSVSENTVVTVTINASGPGGAATPRTTTFQLLACDVPI